MRGGDVVFMHEVIAAYSCDAIQYRDEIQVRHLEIAGPRDWLRKMRIYGESARQYGRIVKARPLTYRERLRIVRAVAKRRRYSAAESGLLGALLMAGAAAYEVGQYTDAARIRPADG